MSWLAEGQWKTLSPSQECTERFTHLHLLNRWETTTCWLTTKLKESAAFPRHNRQAPPSSCDYDAC